VSPAPASQKRSPDQKKRPTLRRPFGGFRPENPRFASDSNLVRPVCPLADGPGWETRVQKRSGPPSSSRFSTCLSLGWEASGRSEVFYLREPARKLFRQTLLATEPSVRRTTSLPRRPDFVAVWLRGYSTRRAAVKDRGPDLPACSEHPATLSRGLRASVLAARASDSRAIPAPALRLVPAWTLTLLSFGESVVPGASRSNAFQRSNNYDFGRARWII
jgi:hypothetical protein